MLFSIENNSFTISSVADDQAPGQAESFSGEIKVFAELGKGCYDDRRRPSMTKDG
jgi:hypothetical protein